LSDDDNVIEFPGGHRSVDAFPFAAERSRILLVNLAQILIEEDDATVRAAVVGWIERLASDYAVAVGKALRATRAIGPTTAADDPVRSPEETVREATV
jgi:hypothetical protein